MSSRTTAAWWAVAGTLLVLWDTRLIGDATSYAWVAAVAIGAAACGLLLVAWSLVALGAGERRPVPRWLTAVGLGVALVAFGVWAVMAVVQAPGYGTDELAFDQYAAVLFLHGLNPYLHSMAPAFTKYLVSPDGYTFSLTGRPVTALSYPALSFLLYVPVLAAGVTAQAAVIVNVVAWGAMALLLYFLLPPDLRPIVFVLGSLSVYIGYAVGGVTDALFVPFLVGAAWQWDRFSRSQGPSRWRGPVLLGLAMAIKQTPWFAAGFLVLGIYAEARLGLRLSRRRALGEAGRYTALAGAVFLVPNLWFLARAPLAWVHGVLTPLLAPTVPAGQGAIGLSLFLDLGGGSLHAYTALSLAALALGALGLLGRYRATKRLVLLLPSLVLFFATRSLGSYLLDLLPAAIVAAVSCLPLGAETERGLWPRAGSGVVLAGLATVGLAGAWAWLARPPLGLRVVRVHTTGQLATVDRVTLLVTNRTGRRLEPHFTVDTGGAVTWFWLVAGGPRTLAPHTRATYSLLAPNFDAQPSISGGFQMVAFTTGPDTVSHSTPYRPTTLHVALEPAAVDREIPVGRPITLTAQLFDPLDRPIHQSGIPVYLGQVVYAQHGLEYGDAIINGHPVGATPVMALTNAAGQAIFVIRGTDPLSDPVYFEANLVNTTQYYPYGYSSIVPIRFEAAR
jgi:hypothetical protein